MFCTKVYWSCWLTRTLIQLDRSTHGPAEVKREAKPSLHLLHGVAAIFPGPGRNARYAKRGEAQALGVWHNQDVPLSHAIPLLCTPSLLIGQPKDCYVDYRPHTAFLLTLLETGDIAHSMLANVSSPCICHHKGLRKTTHSSVVVMARLTVLEPTQDYRWCGVVEIPIGIDIIRANDCGPRMQRYIVYGSFEYSLRKPTLRL